MSRHYLRVASPPKVAPLTRSRFQIAMRPVLPVLLLACLVAAASAAGKYNSKYDNFNVDTLIGNDRLLSAYVNCFLDKGRCTPEGAEFKKVLPEAVETTCDKCSPKQKANIKKVIKAIQTRQARQWDELVEKTDPTGQYRDAFNKFIQES